LQFYKKSEGRETANVNAAYTRMLYLQFIYIHSARDATHLVHEEIETAEFESFEALYLKPRSGALQSSRSATRTRGNEVA